MRIFFSWLSWAIVLLVATHQSAYAQSVKTYSTQDGLPSAEVFHITQDRSGFLWFSTSNGIAVFDGYEMKAFSVYDGVPDPLVLETREDEEGRMWLRSYSGRIAYHKDGVIYPFIYNDTLSKFCSRSFLESFVQDSTGKWIFYESGDRWGSFNENGKFSWQKLARERIVITDYGKHLIIQNANDGVRAAKVFIDGKQFHVDIPYQDPKYAHHHLSALRWKDKVYFSVRNNLFCYNGKTIDRVFVAGAAIINLSIDREDRLYIGHMNYGALRFENENFNSRDTLSFTKNHSITTVLEDHEGGLWVSTLEAGVLYAPSTGIEHFYIPENPRIKSATTDKNNIYIGTNDGQILALDIKTKTVQKRQKLDRGILSLYVHNDTLFAGTSTYLYILKDIERPPIRSFYGSTQGIIERTNDIFVLTRGDIARYSKSGLYRSRIRYPEKVRDIYVDKSRSYVLSHLGLLVCDQNLSIIDRPKKLEHFKISQAVSINDTTLLLGTLGSGLLITDKAFSRVTRFESLPRDIYSIVQLGEQFYFASEQGIFSIRAEDLLDGSFRSIMLNSGNGLLDKPIVLLKASHDGKLIVFYDRAFSIIDPQAMKNLNKTPKFYLQQVSINNQKITVRDHYFLPYDSNTIQFDFSFVSYNNQDINIRYRLNETDSWIYPRRTGSINLYSLAPGDYKPEFEYSADRFTWQKANAIPTIKIAYPWWKNPYVQGMTFVVLCMVAIIIVQNRLDIQRERNERLRLLTVQQQMLLDTEKQTTERERNRIAKDLHDSVGSSLLAIKLSIGRILKRYNHSEADEIDHQLTNTLNEIKGIIYDLTPSELERDGLGVSVRNYIDKLSGVTDITLHVVFYGEDVSDTRISVPVFRILQELLSNSIKYSNGNSISIHINSFDSLLNIVYEDNGQGFSPLKSRGTGLGLINIEQRVERLNGKIKSDSGTYGTSYIIDIPKITQ